MGSEILIVDDVSANRFILRDIITEMGHKPILTENGLQALRILEKRKPGLIILDIAMPEMDGYEVCQKVKSNPSLREIPIVFISAFDDPTDIVKGFELGGEDYVTKPFIPAVVKSRVDMHLKLAEANKNLQEMNRKLQVSVTEQLNQMEQGKKNVLSILNRIVREIPMYEETYMKRLCYNTRILTEAMQLSVQYGNMISDRCVESIELAAPLYIMNAEVLKDIRRLEKDNTFVEIALGIADAYDGEWKPYDTIPMCAQIVAVADAYCKLKEEGKNALEEIAQGAEKRYNPDIISILCKISRQLH